jgi:hypothetical protein
MNPIPIRIAGNEVFSSGTVVSHGDQDVVLYPLPTPYEKYKVELQFRSELGRGLITRGQPQPDRRKLYECKVVGSQPVIARCNATALLDSVEEALDLVAIAVEIGAKIDRITAIA